MADNVVDINITDLTDPEITEIQELAGELGADLRELAVVAIDGDTPLYVTIAVSMMSTFLTEIVKSQVPQFLRLIERIRKGRNRVALKIADADVILIWDDTTKRHSEAAARAIAEIDVTGLPRKAILRFEADLVRWTTKRPESA
jgi:hypothetical protein